MQSYDYNPSDNKKFMILFQPTQHLTLELGYTALYHASPNLFIFATSTAHRVMTCITSVLLNSSVWSQSSYQFPLINIFIKMMKIMRN